MSHYTMAKSKVTCTSSFCCFLQRKISNIYQYFVVVFKETIILSLMLVEYEMILSNSKACSWNNM